MPKIYISPSTQEHNVGAGSFGTEEKRMNQIADVVCKCMTACNITWYRNTPSLDLGFACKDSNSKLVDFHFAIHSNAGGGRGCEVIVNKLGGNAERFAWCIYNQLAPITPTSDRGVKALPSIYETNPVNVKAPSCLVEVAFHDDVNDANFIINNIIPIGIALSKGICNYFGAKFINPYATVTSLVGKTGIVRKTKMLINGVVTEVDAVNIDGYNFVQLRDLSTVVSVGYDAVKQIAILNSK